MFYSELLNSVLKKTVNRKGGLIIVTSLDGRGFSTPLYGYVTEFYIISTCFILPH